MGTEVLRPHDCLTERIRLPPAVVYPRRRSSYNGRRPAPSKQKQNPPQRLAMEQITILKRREPLDLRPRAAKSIVSGTDPVYAGSAFSVSPAPESLPLPSFSRMKQVSMTVDDSATRDLRRLLRLD